MTQKLFEDIYNQFSKHLNYVSKKYKISEEEVCKVVKSYIDVNYDFDNNIDDNVNYD